MMCVVQVLLSLQSVIIQSYFHLFYLLIYSSLFFIVVVVVYLFTRKCTNNSYKPMYYTKT